MPFLVAVIDLPGHAPGRNHALDAAMMELQYVAQTPKGHPLPDTTFVAKIPAPVDVSTALEAVRRCVDAVGLTPRGIVVVGAADPDLRIAAAAPRAEGAELSFAAVEPDE